MEAEESLTIADDLEARLAQVTGSADALKLQHDQVLSAKQPLCRTALDVHVDFTATHSSRPHGCGFAVVGEDPDTLLAPNHRAGRGCGCWRRNGRRASAR